MIHKVTIFGCILQVVSDSMLAELKQCFLEAYDDNNDGKIDIREVKTITNIFFCYLFGIHLHLLQKKTLSAFGYSSYYIYTSQKSKGKKTPTFTESEAFFSAWDIAKSFFMHFLLFILAVQYFCSECISCIRDGIDVIERS